MSEVDTQAFLERRAALAEWLRHIAGAQLGARIEVGLIYDGEHGWRVYQRIGHKAIMMFPRFARAVAASYEAIKAQPQWRDLATGLEPTFASLRDLAAEADEKNAGGVKPTLLADAVAGHA